MSDGEAGATTKLPVLCFMRFILYSILFHRRMIPLQINHNAISSRLPLSFSRCNCVVAHATYLMAIIAQHRRSEPYICINEKINAGLAPRFAIFTFFHDFDVEIVASYYFRSFLMELKNNRITSNVDCSLEN